MIHLASSTSLTWYWFWHPLQGVGYQFWSGIASDVGELTIVSGLAAVYWSHTCHVGRCLRFGRHRLAGGKYAVCRHHLPGAPEKLTVAHIHAEHAAHLTEANR